MYLDDFIYQQQSAWRHRKRMEAATEKARQEHTPKATSPEVATNVVEASEPLLARSDVQDPIDIKGSVAIHPALTLDNCEYVKALSNITGVITADHFYKLLSRLGVVGFNGQTFCTAMIETDSQGAQQAMLHPQHFDPAPFGWENCKTVQARDTIQNSGYAITLGKVYSVWGRLNANIVIEDDNGYRVQLSQYYLRPLSN